MTENFKFLMYAFGRAVRGEKAESGIDADIKAVMKLAENQGVKQIVYSALTNGYDVSEYELPVISAVAQNIRKNNFIHSVVQKITDAGIECCYLKGITVARFYSEPDARISGDTDIYVDKKNLKKAREILAENGFSLESLSSAMYHFEAHHAVGGLLEVHYSFSRDKVKDLIFRDMLSFDEAHTELEISGMKIKTFGINDSLNYLTSHMVKHFVTDGIALRQIMDLLLYMQHYEKEIVWEKYRALWQELGFLSFIDTLCGIGTKYWGFNFGEYSDENVEKLLNDIECGGLFGFNEKQRRDFLDLFFAQKYRGNEETVEKYMNKNPIKRIFGLLFPTRTYMKKRGYREVEKGGIYIPLAYIHRLWDLFVSVVMGKKSIKKSLNYTTYKVENSVQSKRIDLMKDLKILK